MRSFAPFEDADSTGFTQRWLICMEAQRAHFAPQDGAFGAQLYAKVEACRRLLTYARRNNWRVVHVHRRSPNTLRNTGDPQLRPIEGLEPLPTERLYFRVDPRPLTQHEDPFWRDALAARGAEALLVGHLCERALAAVSWATDEMGLRMVLVDDAIWRPAPDQGRSRVDIMSPLAAERLCSMQSRQAMAPRLTGPLEPANAP